MWEGEPHIKCRYTEKKYDSYQKSIDNYYSIIISTADQANIPWAEYTINFYAGIPWDLRISPKILSG